jgi:hypothetical protein
VLSFISRDLERKIPYLLVNSESSENNKITLKLSKEKINNNDIMIWMVE